MDEWVWSNGGIILTRENWTIGRKTLYTVCGRWMNEYGAMVEWYWHGKTELIQVKTAPVPLSLHHQHVSDTEHSIFMSLSAFSIHFCLFVCNFYRIFIRWYCRLSLATLPSALLTDCHQFKWRLPTVFGKTLKKLHFLARLSDIGACTRISVPHKQQLNIVQFHALPVDTS